MPTFAFYADEQRKFRPDGTNFIIASGVDVTTARQSAEQLINDPNAFAEFKVVEMTDTTPSVIVQGQGPVGRFDQSTWPTLSRGGNTLK